MKNGLRISVLAVLVFLSGCAFGTRRFALTYDTALPAQSAKNISVCVNDFKDTRSAKDNVGYVRNGWGMRCGKAVPTNDVAKWVSDSLKAELKNAGYTVACDGSTVNNIDGECFSLICDAGMSYEGRIGIRVVLKKDKQEAFSKTYNVESNGGLNWAGTSGGFATTLKGALQEALKQAMMDLEAQLK